MPSSPDQWAGSVSQERMVAIMRGLPSLEATA